jgi:hypothetical protein
MDITITFDSGRWIADPNPAIVTLGTHVRFVVRASRSDARDLRWVVSFQRGSPFRERRQWTVETRNTGLGTGVNRLPQEAAGLLEALNISAEVAFDHRAVTEPASADEPGEYKYDLRVDDPDTNQIVSEEDPLLVVLRGPFRI